MNKKLLLGFLFLILLINVNADLGDYKQNSCVTIKAILDSDAANISTISFPDSTIAASNIIMSKTDKTFSYEFCDTRVLGEYIYDFYDANNNTFVNTFNIVESDLNQDWGVYIVTAIIWLIFLIGMKIEDYPITFISGMGLFLLGVYVVIPTIDNLLSNTLTLAFGIIHIGMGAYIMMKASNEQYNIF